MEAINSFKETLKKNSLSIFTTIIVCLVMFGYFTFIQPDNEKKEDDKNIEILENFENQLKEYVDDQIKHVNYSHIKESEKLEKLKLENYYIDYIDANPKIKIENGKIELPRIIHFKKDNNESKEEEEDTIEGTISIDLLKFKKRISSNTDFSSFFICQIEDRTTDYESSKNEKSIKENQKYNINPPLLSENTSPEDLDSLLQRGLESGPFNFENSRNRYYAKHIIFHDLNLKLYLAAGIQKEHFQNNVNFIQPKKIIIYSICILVLLFSISLIKPIISSHKETLSDLDFLKVVSSIGFLLMLLIVVSIIFIWDNSVKSKNENDLKGLSDCIESDFSAQITCYKKLYSKEKGKFIKVNYEKTKYPKDVFKINTSDSLYLSKLQTLAKIESNGVLTKLISRNYEGGPRKYADRKYFKMLQNTDTTRVLTTVFSRSNDKYQWIYAERDITGKIHDTTGIKLIAFEDYLSDHLKLPHGTEYIILDKEGNILSRSNSTKKSNFYQNLLLGTENKLQLQTLLSGLSPQSFEIELQGTKYQVYAKKLEIEDLNTPIFTLALRDLTHLDRISLFSFTNVILLVLAFFAFNILINLVASSLFYRNRVSLASMIHFHHLFLDNSRTAEYKMLSKVFIISGILSIFLSFTATPLTAIIIFFIVSVNLNSATTIILNIRSVNPKKKPKKLLKELLKLLLILLIFSTIVPIGLIYIDQFFFAFVSVFLTHIGLILYYKKWRERMRKDNNPFDIEKYAINNNRGVNRKAYTNSITSKSLFYFVIFPFVMINSYYIGELNDFLYYNCTEGISNKSDSKKVIDAYGCLCAGEQNLFSIMKSETPKDSSGSRKASNDTIIPVREEEIMRSLNLGILERPLSFEIINFKIDSGSKYKYYLGGLIILDNFPINLCLIIMIFIFIAYLARQLFYFYGDLFFNYDLMQAAYERYFPYKKIALTNDYIFLNMIEKEEIEQLIQKTSNSITLSDELKHNKRKNEIGTIFNQDTNNEITPIQRMQFIYNYNVSKFEEEYQKIWNDLSPDHKLVLFDFAKDYFINYKNKHVLMSFMEKGIVDTHKITGRLKLMNPSFRFYILSQNQRNENFSDEYKIAGINNGTFSKFKTSIMIIAFSAMVLLLYLNRDSYDRLAAVGSGIGPLILFIERILNFVKTS